MLLAHGDEIQELGLDLTGIGDRDPTSPPAGQQCIGCQTWQHDDSGALNRTLERAAARTPNHEHRHHRQVGPAPAAQQRTDLVGPVSCLPDAVVQPADDCAVADPLGLHREHAAGRHRDVVDVDVLEGHPVPG